MTTGLDEIVAGVEAMIDGDIVVTPLDRVKLCLGWSYFENGVRTWQGFDLGRSEDMDLRHRGSKPYVDRGSVKEIRWRSTRLRPIVDIDQDCDYNVQGGFDGHLPTLFDY